MQAKCSFIHIQTSCQYYNCYCTKVRHMYVTWSGTSHMVSGNTAQSNSQWKYFVVTWSVTILHSTWSVAILCSTWLVAILHSHMVSDNCVQSHGQLQKCIVIWSVATLTAFSIILETQNIQFSDCINIFPGSDGFVICTKIFNVFLNENMC